MFGSPAKHQKSTIVTKFWAFKDLNNARLVSCNIRSCQLNLCLLIWRIRLSAVCFSKLQILSGGIMVVSGASSCCYPLGWYALRRSHSFCAGAGWTLNIFVVFQCPMQSVNILCIVYMHYRIYLHAGLWYCSSSADYSSCCMLPVARLYGSRETRVNCMRNLGYAWKINNMLGGFGPSVLCSCKTYSYSREGVPV